MTRCPVMSPGYLRIFQQNPWLQTHTDLSIGRTVTGNVIVAAHRTDARSTPMMLHCYHHPNGCMTAWWLTIPWVYDCMVAHHPMGAWLHGGSPSQWVHDCMVAHHPMDAWLHGGSPSHGCMTAWWLTIPWMHDCMVAHHPNGCMTAWWLSVVLSALALFNEVNTQTLGPVSAWIGDCMYADR